MPPIVIKNMILLTTFGTLFAPLPAAAFKGDVEFCNKSSKEVKFAIGYDVPGSTVPISRGWFVVAPCACKQALRQEIAATEVFVFASKTGGVTPLWTGAAAFCVHPTDAFKYSNPTNNSQASCERKGGRWVKFKMHDTGGQGVKVNYRPGNSTCID